MSPPLAVPRHPDGTPQRLGRYRLVRPISTGGMARVFEGRRESLAGVAPKVAIKVILPDFAADAAFRDLFVNEARIGSLMQHGNLVQIQDFDLENGVYYLVMEYVEGVTLRRAISLGKRHGVPASLTVLAELGRQVCDGLQYAHSVTSEEGHPLQLVHRDIKPSNLIINPQGVVKVLDFGISKALLVYEREGAVRGTWGYMAPEQAEGQPVTGAADLFGLAAVLYEAATGRALFPEKEPGAIRGLLAKDEAARRAARLTGPLSPLSGVLVRALQRDPAARYASAEAMGRALATLLKDPVLSRDELVRFQQSITALAAPGGASSDRARSGASLGSAGSAASASSLAPAGPSVGLPVAIGGPPPGVRPAPPPPPPARPARPLLPVVLGAAAIGIVSFTAWQLVQDQPGATPSQGPAAVKAGDNPFAGFEEDPSAAPAPAPAPAPSPAPSPAPTPAPAPSPAPAPAPSPAPAPAPAPDEPPPRIAPPAPAPAPAPAPSPAPEAAPAPAPANATRGSLTVSSIPRAQVIVDGRFVRYTPLFQHDVEAGDRVVTLITDDGRRTTFTIPVPGGGDARRIWSFDEGRFIQR